MRLPLLFLVALLATGCSRIVHLFDRRIDLEILSTLQTRYLGSVSGGSSVDADDGEFFLVLEVEVTNPAWREDFKVPYSAFSVKTDSGLEFEASNESSSLTDACDGDSKLTKGASLSCALVFELPDDDDPVQLIFLTTQ